jgi:Uma2 family endonuclease
MIQRQPIANDLVDYETYRSLVKDGEKAELIDGVIYMALPDTKLSNTLNLFIANLIDGFTTARKIEGFTFLSRFSCKLSKFRAPEPDVGYVRPERTHLVEERHMLGGPNIAVEIVSRESRRRDCGEKRDLYQEAGVSEYWIVDPLQSRAEFLALQEGRYALLPLEKNQIFRCSVIPEFWLDVSWLLARPVPRAYRCLEQMLSAPKKKPSKRKR